jgi:dGTPase
MKLAAFACDPANSRGRRLPEPAAPTRTEYQRDRDRVVHSTAFRRLVYKTQVFVNHEGDLFRTRLTHSLEVAQLGRSIARSLALNEDLVEAIALAHDLGHTPFGHAGQDALNQCMAGHGGFEHNLQSLRVVDRLEQRYPGWDGLNLSFETREGLLKRCSRPLAEALELAEPGGVGQRFLVGTQPSLEAQLCNLADEIAYNAHDVDDGVRSGYINLDQLQEVPLIARYTLAVGQEYPELRTQAPRRFLAEVIRRMLSDQVYDVINTSAARLAQSAPLTADAARELPVQIAFSDAMRHDSAMLKRFLFSHLYRHPQVTATSQLGQQIVRELFAAYDADPTQLPNEGLRQSTVNESAQRTVADYIAGMTDRFATKEHRRLTGKSIFQD